VLNVVDSGLCSVTVLPPRVNSYVYLKDSARVDTAWIVNDKALDIEYTLSLNPTDGLSNAFEFVNPNDISGIVRVGEWKPILLRAILHLDTGHYADMLLLTTGGGYCSSVIPTRCEYTIIDSIETNMKLLVTPPIIYFEADEGYTLDNVFPEFDEILAENLTTICGNLHNTIIPY